MAPQLLDWIGISFAQLAIAANGLLTMVTLRLGFQFYGYSYFSSALIAFAAAFIATDRYIRHLPYQTFVRNNASVVY